jgi:hypothetical protein
MKLYPSSYFIVLLLISAFCSCKSSINAADLYGKWKYVKDEQPHSNFPSTTSAGELKAANAYIQFSKDSSLAMFWGGKEISHGKFSIDGYNIRYTESLPGGTTRQFPFWVMKLTNQEIVFETSGEDGTRITAEKE